MSNALLDAPAFHPCPPADGSSDLAAMTDKLAELRFLIILTARWEGGTNVDREERSLMRGDLVRLRKQYSDSIDQIAMTHGVQHAMDAQHDVERRVHVPLEIRPARSASFCEGDDEAQEDEPQI